MSTFIAQDILKINKRISRLNILLGIYSICITATLFRYMSEKNNLVYVVSGDGVQEAKKTSSALSLKREKGEVNVFSSLVLQKLFSNNHETVPENLDSIVEFMEEEAFSKTLDEVFDKKFLETLKYANMHTLFSIKKKKIISEIGCWTVKVLGKFDMKEPVIDKGVAKNKTVKNKILEIGIKIIPVYRSELNPYGLKITDLNIKILKNN